MQQLSLAQLVSASSPRCQIYTVQCSHST